MCVFKEDDSQIGMLVPRAIPVKGPLRGQAQSAFKGLMIHGEVLQFTLLIAVGCVLHRCGSQDIHC